MLLGFNTNIPYNGNLYHIQTEDKGLKNPKIITCIYLKGKIITSKKISYANIVRQPDCKIRVKKLMARQHIKMMKDLLEGKYTGENKPEEKKGETIQ
jgi:predicted transcriptional regulator